MLKWSGRKIVASFPGLLHTSSFWLLPVCKNGGRRLENFITWSTAQLSKVDTPPLNSQVIYETNLTFCGSYKVDKCQQSYTECMKNPQAKTHDSKRLQSDKRENIQQWRDHLVEWKDGTIWSCTAYITAIPERLSFEPGYVLQVGLNSSLELVSIL